MSMKLVNSNWDDGRTYCRVIYFSLNIKTKKVFTTFLILLVLEVSSTSTGTGHGRVFPFFYVKFMHTFPYLDGLSLLLSFHLIYESNQIRIFSTCCPLQTWIGKIISYKGLNNFSENISDFLNLFDLKFSLILFFLPLFFTIFINDAIWETESDVIRKISKH